MSSVDEDAGGAEGFADLRMGLADGRGLADIAVGMQGAHACRFELLDGGLQAVAVPT